MTHVLGVDPGIRGGLALVDNAKRQIIDSIDLPVVGVGAKERIDVHAIRSWVEQHRPDHAVIERAGVMPKQGIASGFKYGRAVGAIEAVIALCGVPMTSIEPTAWKKYHGLRGGDKEASRQRALQLLPAAHELLARKRDHGRAEAALIASVPIQGVVPPAM